MNSRQLDIGLGRVGHNKAVNDAVSDSLRDGVTKVR